jgi:hypothetical protein
MLPDPRTGDISCLRGRSPLLRDVGIPGREKIRGGFGWTGSSVHRGSRRQRSRYDAAPFSPETVYSMLAPYTPALIVEPSTLHWAK